MRFPPYPDLGLLLVAASGHPDEVQQVLTAAERADTATLIEALKYMTEVVGQLLDQAEDEAAGR